MVFQFLGEGFALGAAICWAVGPLVAYRGVDALGTFRFSQFRYSVSAVMLLLLTVGFGSFHVADWRSVAFLMASGVIGVAFGEALLFQAIHFLGPRIASIIFSLHAPITAFTGALIFSEAISVWSVLGIALAVSGAYTASIFRSRSESAGGEWHKLGRIGHGVSLALGAVALQVIGALLAKDAMAAANPLFASFLRCTSAGIAFLPIYIVLRERDREVESADLRYVFYSAALSTVGGMTLLLAAFAYTEIFRAVVIASLSPVLYILIMGVVRAERFPLGVWAGTVVAVFGVVLTIANV